MMIVSGAIDMDRMKNVVLWSGGRSRKKRDNYTW